MPLDITSEIIIFIAGLGISAFFSASEAVLMSIPVDRAKQLIEEGGKKSNALKFLVSHSTELLTTILLGNNFVNAFVAAQVTTIAARYFGEGLMATSVGISTFFILIFGEISPKTFARSSAELLVYPVVKILQVFYFITWPFTWPLNKFIKLMLGKNAQLHGKIITTDDLEYLVNRAEEDKSIDSKHIDLISSILEFPTIKVKDIMIPRSKIDALPIDATFKEVTDVFHRLEHSRYPVYDGDLDKVAGFVHVKDFAFLAESKTNNFSLSQYINQAFFVYEQMRIQSVFDYLNRSKVHMALVRDENGTVVGLITLEDIMEEIFGEISDEHDDEREMAQVLSKLSDVGILVPGSITIRDLNSDYDIHIPLNDGYSTLTGFLLDLLGNHFPKQGQIIFWDDYSFELVNVDNFHIEEVRIKKVEEASGPSKDDKEEWKNTDKSKLVGMKDGQSKVFQLRTLLR
ncbi:MAG: hemolysin family protein [Bacteriovoracaceae bacterium]|nr:hemolysin family protein [Bacteriovoracaceae bacterium]